jgi:Bacteriophage A118-like holin, Hol118
MYEIPEMSLGTVAVVPIILAICQAIKMVGVANKWIPLISIGLGIGISLLASPLGGIGNVILNGTVMGLSASGLYSGVKVTAHAKNYENKAIHPTERKVK